MVSCCSKSLYWNRDEKFDVQNSTLYKQIHLFLSFLLLLKISERLCFFGWISPIAHSARCVGDKKKKALRSRRLVSETAELNNHNILPLKDNYKRIKDIKGCDKIMVLFSWWRLIAVQIAGRDHLSLPWKRKANLCSGFYTVKFYLFLTVHVFV